jgi:hypothetical protein
MDSRGELVTVDTPTQHVTWGAHHGITQRHWGVFRRYAESSRVYLLIRGAPPAAIPWIERVFPPRPYELAFLDVEPGSGLLLAQREAQRVRVFAHGHYVLTSAVDAALPERAEVGGAAGVVARASPGGGTVGPFLGVNPRQAPLGVLFRDPWARAGVVVDRRTHRPFTAPYELLAVLGEDDEFHQLQAVGAAAKAAAPLGWRRGSDSGAAVPFVALVRQDLNGLIEGERVLDGTRPRPPGPGTSGGGAAGRGGMEELLVFRPDGLVSLLRTRSGGWSRVAVRTVVAG